MKKKSKPFWERAYKGHGYWLGKKMLGKVTLLPDDAKGKYHWSAAGRSGHAEDLEKARAAVELAVYHADRQMDLFPALDPQTNE